MWQNINFVVFILAIFLVGFGFISLSGCGDEQSNSLLDVADVPDTADEELINADSEDEELFQPEALTFPEGFIFGTAVSGFQVDMGCPTLPPEVCVDANSDWYEFVTSSETINGNSTYLTGHDPSLGPGHWELFEEDFDRVANELSNNGFRFSLEWSRIFPTSTEGIEGYDALLAVADQEVIAHYHSYLAALNQRGLTPLVTLNHYTLPLWIHDGVGCHLDLETCTRKGWADKERILTEIEKYSAFAATEFGGEVDLWATLNEPFAVLFPGYIFPSEDRSNPPSVMMATEEARIVLSGLIEGHARMYDAVKEHDQVDADGDSENSMVGVVYALAPAAPIHPDREQDIIAAENVFYLWNMVYLNAVIRGEFDETLDHNPIYRADLDNRMDYLGINYYTRVKVEGMGTAALPEFSPLTTFNPLTIEPWENYPDGLYDMAMFIKEEFGIPMIITENGVADPDDDGTGSEYLVRHLSWLSRAIRDGADVRGYFYWTLMDNYEWNHGLDIQMGLYSVDPNDKSRTPRKTVEDYSSIARELEVSEGLQQRYPIGK